MRASQAQNKISVQTRDQKNFPWGHGEKKRRKKASRPQCNVMHRHVRQSHNESSRKADQHTVCLHVL